MAKKKTNDTTPDSVNPDENIPLGESVEQIICRTQGVGITIAKSVAATIGEGQRQKVQTLAAAGAGSQEILNELTSKPKE